MSSALQSVLLFAFLLPPQLVGATPQPGSPAASTPASSSDEVALTGEEQVSNTFTTKGEAGAKFAETEVTSVQGADAAVLAGQVASDSHAERVAVFGIDVPGSTAVADATSALSSTLNASNPDLSIHSQTTSVKADIKHRAKFFGLVYQEYIARPLWTVFKCTTYAHTTWYLIFVSNGYFDFWMPMVTVAISAICAWKIEAMNRLIENFKPIFTRIRKDTPHEELNSVRKFSIAVARMVEPVLATAVIESVLYYGILQFSDTWQSAHFPNEYNSKGIIEVLRESSVYGTRAFFTDYAMALAVQKVIVKSEKGLLFKHATCFHIGIFLSMATFLGNFGQSMGVKWTAPIMMIMTGAGTLAYGYVKLPVLKAIVAGLVRIIPAYRDSERFKSWMAEFNVDKDFIDDIPPLLDVARKSVMHKVLGCAQRLAGRFGF